MGTYCGEISHVRAITARKCQIRPSQSPAGGLSGHRSTAPASLAAAKHLYLIMATVLPTTLGALRASEFTPSRLARSVKDELRENLIARLRANGKSSARGQGDPVPLFPGIVGYEDTVIPQLVNAVLSRHNFILLGLRGQAKS